MTDIEIAEKVELERIDKIAKKLNIEAKSHLSSIDEADANKIKESVKNLTAKKPEKKMNQEKTKKEEKNDSPVIIRREVIINDEANVQKEQVKKEEKKNNHVGFVERKQNKDYNIVYRNKPSKPMTVDELFGIKKEPKKEEKKEEKVEIKEEKPQTMEVPIKETKNYTLYDELMNIRLNNTLSIADKKSKIELLSKLADKMDTDTELTQDTLGDKYFCSLNSRRYIKRKILTR